MLKIKQKIDHFNKILFLLSPAPKTKIIFLIFLMFISLVLEIFGLSIIIPMITIFSDFDNINKNSFFYKILTNIGGTEQNELIFFSIIFLLIFFFIKSLFVGYVLFKQLEFTFDTQKKLSSRLFDNYLKLPYEKFIELNTSILIKNITKETQLFALNCIQPFLYIFSQSLIFFGITVIIIIIEPIGATISFIALCIPGVFFYFFSKNKILEWGKSRMLHDENRFQFIQEGLGALKIIKIFNKENFFLKKYELSNFGSAKQDMRVRFVDQLPRLLLEFFAILGFCILFLLLIYQNIDEKKILPILGLFAFGIFRIIPSLNKILSQITNLKFSEEVVDVLYKELKNYKKDDINIEEKKFLINNINNKIEFKNVDFVYPHSEKIIFKDLNIKISKGEKIGIIGSSGIGKSTFLDLLLGVIKPQKGEILYDGKNIKNLNLNYKKILGYVPQSIFLIDGSIKENIAFGIQNDEINLENLEQSVKRSAIENYIKSLPNGLNTNVGERGIKLSGGQIQRIGLSRAMYLNPEMIILDEATSALDRETEEKIMDTIFNLNKDKTIIIVTHKLDTIKECDKIYKIEDCTLNKID